MTVNERAYFFSKLRLVGFVALLLALFASYTACRWLFPFRPILQEYQTKAAWITVDQPGAYAAYLRKTINLPADAESAWLSVSACDAFEVIVNDNTLGGQTLWRPTRPFQNGLSETGQKPLQITPIIGLNYPREYQWTGHKTWQLPVYFDLTPALHPGGNTICLEIESRRLPPKVNVEGRIRMRDGRIISLQSDASWKASDLPVKQGSFYWSDPRLDDGDWTAAKVVEGPSETLFATVDSRAFGEPFHASWMRSPGQVKAASLWFERDIEVAPGLQSAWIRVLSNRNYDLFINDQKVRTSATDTGGQDEGEWGIGDQRTLDLPEQPELLDPDEVGNVFVGKKYLSPPHGDPTASDFHAYENTQNRTRERPNANVVNVPGDFDADSEIPQGNAKFFDRSDYAPTLATPKASIRNRQMAAFDLYSVRWMLHSGKNKISVRLAPPDSVHGFNWQPEVALDMEVQGREIVKPLTGNAGWRTRLQDFSGHFGNAERPMFRAVVWDKTKRLPTKFYAGDAYNPGRKVFLWGSLSAGIVLLVFTVLALGIARHPAVRDLRRGAPKGREAGFFVKELSQALLVPMAFCFAALLVEASWGERHEMLLLYNGTVWGWIFGATILLTAGVFLRFFRVNADAFSHRARRIAVWLRTLPRLNLWRFGLLWLLLLAGFLRYYKCADQPLDDDEYASTQAILAIAEHGTPHFTDMVFYTRSPLFHYLAAAFVKVLGPHLWAMRLPSVLAGVATVWLIYLCGSRLLGSRWVGLSAAILYTIHPYAIFTGHLVRFYQQQQFFSLLAIYFFCRGFVTGQEMRHRYWTVAAFLGAVLSQELSLLIIVPLGAGYLLFAGVKKLSDELRLATVLGCALALILVDLLIFQTQCLTRVDGISPNVEATLALNFNYPINFLSIFLAYSRLHLALTVFLLFGLPLAVRGGNRNLLALVFIFVTGLVATNIMVTGVGLRYQYWLLPIWLLLGIAGLKALVSAVVGLGLKLKTHQHRRAWMTPFLATLGFATVVLSWSPWRIPGSYDTKIVNDSASAFQFVAGQKRPGDIVMATEPHPHAGLLEIGHIDYDLSIPPLYDFMYQKNGRLVDRNAGAEAISNMADFQKVCSSNRRVWVLVNREKMRSRTKNIRWEYPGGRIELFLRENCALKYRSYLWAVYLWDMDSGHYRSFQTAAK